MWLKGDRGRPMDYGAIYLLDFKITEAIFYANSVNSTRCCGWDFFISEESVVDYVCMLLSM